MVSMETLYKTEDSKLACVPPSIRARDLLAGIPGGCTAQRYRILQVVLSKHPHAEVVVCGDERTGVRFGERRCRAGYCIKLGGGGRNFGSRRDRAYQVRAVWPAQA